MLTGTCTTGNSYKTLTLDELNDVISELKSFRISRPRPVIMYHFIDATSVLTGKLVNSCLQCEEDEMGIMVPFACKSKLEYLYKNSITLNPFSQIYRETSFSELTQTFIMGKLDSEQVENCSWEKFGLPIL